MKKIYGAPKLLFQSKYNRGFKVSECGNNAQGLHNRITSFPVLFPEKSPVKL